MSEMLQIDLGKPLHSLVIPGKMHFLESDILKTFALNSKTFDQGVDISQH